MKVTLPTGNHRTLIPKRQRKG